MIELKGSNALMPQFMNKLVGVLTISCHTARWRAASVPDGPCELSSLPNDLKQPLIKDIAGQLREQGLLWNAHGIYQGEEDISYVILVAIQNVLTALAPSQPPPSPFPPPISHPPSSTNSEAGTGLIRPKNGNLVVVDFELRKSRDRDGELKSDWNLNWSLMEEIGSGKEIIDKVGWGYLRSHENATRRYK
jgi:hypothetical protein